LQHAFDNSPLPIGSGQTISQPFIVALMTDVAAPETHDKVLEVGTGSGYQTAILAELVNQLYTVEILPEMARAARQRLDTIG
ncbi:protein-L-isoaspartate O-methyltransferase, partial [Candidatus Endoriftia persephone str. Guaymas]|nr:protein-L-isoaspartate O-methyltransferase [Candidatus Endoriftia persephone str. Guaymas]